MAAQGARAGDAHLPLLLLENFRAHCYVLVELSLQNSAASMGLRFQQVCQVIISRSAGGKAMRFQNAAI